MNYLKRKNYIEEIEKEIVTFTINYLVYIEYYYQKLHLKRTYDIN